MIFSIQYLNDFILGLIDFIRSTHDLKFGFGFSLLVEDNLGVLPVLVDFNSLVEYILQNSQNIAKPNPKSFFKPTNLDSPNEGNVVPEHLAEN
jgi:hypothetical protein